MRLMSFSVILLLFCSCVSTQGSGGGAKTAKSIEDFPVISVTTMDNGDVPSYFDAGIIDNPLSAGGQKIFGENVVYSLSSTYKLYGKESTIDYYVIVFNFKKTISKTDNVKKTDKIGKSTGKDPKILVFCKTIDPFFVISCGNLPYFYDDFYWFEGSFLFPSSNPKWLNFEPMDNIEKKLIDMADHAKESSSSLNYYTDSTYRFKTKLNKSPRKATDNELKNMSMYENLLYNRTGITTHVSEFQAGQYKYLLCWQKGFDQYLSKEYKINSDVWIFGAAVTYNIFQNCGYIFVRDFTLSSLEDMYESRMEIINRQLKQ
jgi:hypothetical protein